MIWMELLKIHLLLQFRNRQILWATIFFAVFLIFLFNLAFPGMNESQPGFFSGIFWISSFFSGNLVLGNQTQLQTNKFHQGILLTGTDATHIFFAKMVSSLIYMTFVQLILVFTMSLFFPWPSGIRYDQFAIYAILGSVGYISIGTLFFSLIEFQSIKDLLITVLFYPLVIPLFLYLHKGTTMVFAGKLPNVIDFVIGYDLIFVFLSALLYEFVIEDSQ